MVGRFPYLWANREISTSAPWFWEISGLWTLGILDPPAKTNRELMCKSMDFYASGVIKRP